jgi:hypothetical protein
MKDTILGLIIGLLIVFVTWIWGESSRIEYMETVYGGKYNYVCPFR